MTADVKVEIRFGEFEMLAAENHFNKALTAIESANGMLATVQQVAQARTVANPNHNVNRHGSWVAENYVYFPNGQVLVTSADYSPILKCARRATSAHRNKEEFYLSQKEADRLEQVAKEDKEKPPIECRVYTLDRHDSYEISLSNAAVTGEWQFLFKNDAPAYADFLQRNNIRSVPVELAGSKYQKGQSRPFARVLWLRSIRVKSTLGGFGKRLDADYRVRGIRPLKDATHPYVAIAENYGIKTPKDLKSALELYAEAKRRQF